MTSQRGKDWRREVGFNAPSFLTAPEYLLAVLLAYDFCNELAQTWWLETKQTYYLTVPEVRV